MTTNEQNIIDEYRWDFPFQFIGWEIWKFPDSPTEYPLPVYGIRKD